MGDMAGIGGVSSIKLRDAKTWTGLSLDKIRKEASRVWPAKAKKPIDGGPMKGKTDIAFHYARRRVERIFGPQGIGWRIVPHPTLGKVIATSSQRAGREYWSISLEAHIFEFAVLLPDDGGIARISNSPMSDGFTANTAMSKGYVYRGAMTSLLKQALRGWGGFDSLYGTEGDDELTGVDGEAQEAAPSTGLTTITADTKVADMSLSWLSSAEGVEKLLKQFGDKTLGELPDSVTNWLKSQPKLPPELWAYLSTLKANATPKDDGASKTNGAKPADKAAAPKSAAPKPSNGASAPSEGASKPTEGAPKSAPAGSAKPADGPVKPSKPTSPSAAMSSNYVATGAGKPTSGAAPEAPTNGEKPADGAVKSAAPAGLSQTESDGQ